MARKVLPDFASISEFFSFHGDCGQTATLAALHTIDPLRWPLAGAALDAMTRDQLAHGEADPGLSGGQNIPSLDRYLARVGVAHTTVGYGDYAQDRLHNDLKTLAGVKPVVVEWANAGALPGDESGVKFHYSACGGVDTGPRGDGVGGGYLWADGDNRASPKVDGGGPPVFYTWPQIVAAQPIAYIIIDEPRKEPAGVAWTKQADGGGLDGKGNHCGAGFMAELVAKSETVSDGRMSETYVSGAQGFKSFLPLTNGDVLVWDGAKVAHDGSLVASELYRLLVAAQNQPPKTVTVQVPAPSDPLKDKVFAWFQGGVALTKEM